MGKGGIVGVEKNAKRLRLAFLLPNTIISRLDRVRVYGERIKSLRQNRDVARIKSNFQRSGIPHFILVLATNQ